MSDLSNVGNLVLCQGLSKAYKDYIDMREEWDRRHVELSKSFSASDRDKVGPRLLLGPISFAGRTAEELVFPLDYLDKKKDLAKKLKSLPLDKEESLILGDLLTADDPDPVIQMSAEELDTLSGT